MKGYEESDKIDNRTNLLLEKYPVSKDNFLEWMKYARTVKTTMEIILDECQHIMWRERNK